MTNKHEKMLNSEEMQIRAKMKHHFTLIRLEKNKVCKHQMLAKMCESRNSYITGGSVNWYKCSGEQFGNTLYKVAGVFSLKHSILHFSRVKPYSNLKSDLMQLAVAFILRPASDLTWGAD